jgi:hypothetical protein
VIKERVRASGDLTIASSPGGARLEILVPGRRDDREPRVIGS